MKKLGFCLLALSLVGYAVGCAKEEESTTPAPGTGAGAPADADADKTEEGEEAPATDATN